MKISVPLTEDSYNTYPSDSISLSNSGYESQNIAIEFEGRTIAVERSKLRAALDALDSVKS